MKPNLSMQVAKHLRNVYFGGNWTVSNLKDQLSDVTWEQATAKVGSLNTIAALTYHIHYFVKVVIPVLEGGPLVAHDKYAYDHPPIESKEDWETFLDKVWADAETWASLVEQLPEEKMGETFVDEKWGSYYFNFQGMVEHSHYHLGQIALIKKLLPEVQG